MVSKHVVYVGSIKWISGQTKFAGKWPPPHTHTHEHISLWENIWWSVKDILGLDRCATKLVIESSRSLSTVILFVFKSKYFIWQSSNKQGKGWNELIPNYLNNQKDPGSNKITKK